MIAVDTNILVYAHRRDLPWHAIAAHRLSALAEGRELWAIPWPCAHEFLAKVTHPRIFNQATKLEVALEFLGELARAPWMRFLGESDGYWPLLSRILKAGKVAGPMVHDARIAALCLSHGVSVLWTADRDFGRFPDLAITNPLVG